MVMVLEIPEEVVEQGEEVPTLEIKVVAKDMGGLRPLDRVVVQ
jgi:hypothetical protein